MAPRLLPPQDRPQCHFCAVAQSGRNPAFSVQRMPAYRLSLACLPACIAPRRWYDWAMQQVVLLLLLAGGSLHQGCRQTGRSRSTVRRWRDWLHARRAQFSFFLRSRLPELGRLPEPDFWHQVISSMSLADVMTQLDRDLVVP